jgi:uncharacterized membrane protein
MSHGSGVSVATGIRFPSVALALGVAYPVVAHLAIMREDPELIVVSVSLLGTLILLEPMRRRRSWAWLLLLVGLAGLWRLGNSALATLPLFAPPVLITGGVAWLFGRSLRNGETPLIERIARMMEGSDLDAEHRNYSRKLTVVWAWLTGTLALVNFALALLAVPHGLLATAGIRSFVTVPLATWSLFANVINYLVLGATFVVEFAYRRHRFPGQEHGRFIDFVRGLGRLGPLLTGRCTKP